jgi:ATPase subunit of ABC transporter with duplicated ATPase domains
MQDYAGTIVAISHDRFFLDRIAQRLLVLELMSLAKRPGKI